MEFAKKLASLALPIAFQQFMLALVSASDALMLGAVDQNLLSAVSLAGQVTFVYNLFIAAVTIGLSMFAAQYYGKGDLPSVEVAAGVSLRASLAVSLVFFIATLAFPGPLMRLFTSEDPLIEAGIPYLRAVSASYLACGVSQICLCAMKNCGRATGCMLISSFVVALNIALNAVFIFGALGMPAMGCAGAGAATTVSRAFELVLAHRGMTRRGGPRLRLSCFCRPSRTFKRTYWKYTLPVLGNELVWGCGFTMYSVIMGHLGSDAVAANSIANIAKNLIACFCLGLGGGAGVMVGNELGAGRLNNARDWGNKLCKASVAVGIASGLVLLAASPAIVALAALSETASGYLTGMLAMCSYYMIGKSVNSVAIAGIFCAGGDSRFGFACDAVTLWCFSVPTSALLAFVAEAPVLVVYFIMSLDEVVKLPAVYLHYKKYKWIKDLTKGDAQ